MVDRTLPGIDGTGEAIASLAVDAARRSIAKQRQQLLATMALSLPASRSACSTVSK